MERWPRPRRWCLGSRPGSTPPTAAALGGGFFLRFGLDGPDANWTGGILFDDAVRARTASQNVDNRTLVEDMTDATYFGAMAYRLVDSTLVPGIGGSWDTALQMSLIDLEAFGFVATTLWGSQALFGRERPYVDRCDEPRFAETVYAGHPAVGMTAAGLTCTAAAPATRWPAA